MNEQYATTIAALEEQFPHLDVVRVNDFLINAACKNGEEGFKSAIETLATRVRAMRIAMQGIRIGLGQQMDMKMIANAISSQSETYAYTFQAILDRPLGREERLICQTLAITWWNARAVLHSLHAAFN